LRELRNFLKSWWPGNEKSHLQATQIV
jgi:hypothetical protein